MHCVDLGESFPTSIYLQKSASIQPRTSPSKFRGKYSILFTGVLSHLTSPWGDVDVMRGVQWSSRVNCRTLSPARSLAAGKRYTVNTAFSRILPRGAAEPHPNRPELPNRRMHRLPRESRGMHLASATCVLMLYLLMFSVKRNTSKYY